MSRVRQTAQQHRRKPFSSDELSQSNNEKLKGELMRKNDMEKGKMHKGHKMHEYKEKMHKEHKSIEEHKKDHEKGTMFKPLFMHEVCRTAMKK
jgi:hypothetical protein